MKPPKLTLKRVLGVILPLCCLLLAAALLSGRCLSITVSGCYYTLGWAGLNNMEFNSGIRYGPDGKEVDRECNLGPFFVLYGKRRTN